MRSLDTQEQQVDLQLRRFGVGPKLPIPALEVLNRTSHILRQKEEVDLRELGALRSQASTSMTG